MKGLALGVVVACLMAADAPEAPPPEIPTDSVFFMEGSWVDAAGETEEHWIAPRAGAMLGVNRTIKGGQMVFFEYLRIEKDEQGRFVYRASPMGQSPPVTFSLVAHSDNAVTFENLEHDFPQRILYKRVGDELQMRIEGTEDGQPKSIEWVLRRVDP